MEIKVFLLDQISDFLKIKKNIYLYYSSVDFPSSSLKRKKRNNETVRPSSNYRNITMKLNYYVVWSHFYPLVTDESVSHEDAGRHQGVTRQSAECHGSPLGLFGTKGPNEARWSTSYCDTG